MENAVTAQSAQTHRLLLMDACVLIDFIKADSSIFKLFVKYVGEIHVVSPVVEEVKDIESTQALEKLGLIIIEPKLDDVFTAANQSGSISFQDRLCLLTAKREGFICVTNDKRLRKQCEKDNVQILWGLQLLVGLHEKGGITSADAVELAEQIHKNNPKHISLKLLERFKDAVKD